MGMSRTQQVVALMLVWAAVLIGYDRMFNKHLFAPPASAVKSMKPQIHMYINHLCCSGCQDVAFSALKTLPWLGEPSLVNKEKLPTREEAGSASKEQHGSQSSNGGEVVVDINNVPLVDFVALNEALRKVSLVAGEMEVGGLPHFSLRADIDHMCCKMCVTAAQEGMAPKKDPKFGSTLQWLDSANVSQVGKSITAFVRFGKNADVAEFFRVLDQTGFAPKSVRMVVEADAHQLR